MKLRCVYCGGAIRDGVTTADYNWGGKYLVIFENVPCGVCDQCGERNSDGSDEHQMDLLAQPILKKAKQASEKPLALIDFALHGAAEPPVKIRINKRGLPGKTRRASASISGRATM